MSCFPAIQNLAGTQRVRRARAFRQRTRFLLCAQHFLAISVCTSVFLQLFTLCLLSLNLVVKTYIFSSVFPPWEAIFAAHPSLLLTSVWWTLHGISILGYVSVIVILVIDRNNHHFIIFIRFNVFSIPSPTLINHTAEKRKSYQYSSHHPHVPRPAVHNVALFLIGQMIHLWPISRAKNTDGYHR